MATVMLKVLDGTWETIGQDRFAGIVPEDESVAGNPWGSDTCSFSLRRPIDVPSPDLSAFTDCEIYDAGELIWEGFVQETPGRGGEESVISVAGRGWQYHLDDDVYQRTYVHTRLGDWRDARSFPDAPLTRYNAAGQVEAGDGVIVLGQANGTRWDNQKVQGATLDLGETSRARRVILEYESVNLNGNGAFSLFCRGHDRVGGELSTSNDDFEDAFAPTGAALPGGVLAGTFPTKSWRYVTVFLHWSGAGGDTGSDHLVRIKSIKVFSNPLHADRILDWMQRNGGTYRELVARDDPIALWGLDEPGFTDFSGNDRPATGSGVAITQLGNGPTPNSRSADFPAGAGNAHLQAPASINPIAAVSIELWVRPDTVAGGTRRWVSKEGQYAIRQVDNDLQALLWVGGPAHSITAADVVVAGQWQHFVMTWSDSDDQWRLYRNAVQVAQSARSGPLVATANTVHFGVIQGGGEWYDGKMGEVAIYDKRLTATQVAAHYAARNNGTGYSDLAPANQSYLKASQVVEDAFDLATLLSPDRSGIEPTLFSIPDFAPAEDRTPREMVEAANAFHGYQTKIGPGRVPIFKRQETVPKYTTGGWAAAAFDDAAANSGEEIYNRVIGTCTGPDGQPLRVERWAAQQPGVTGIRIGSNPNPGFETDADGWNGSHSVARSTFFPYSGSGSGRWILQDGTSELFTPPFTGPFAATAVYRFFVAIRTKTDDSAAALAAVIPLRVEVGNAPDTTTTTLSLLGGGVWVLHEIAWMPIVESETATMRFSLANPGQWFTHGPSELWFDGLAVEEVRPTLPDRRGFVRTKSLQVGAAMTAEALQQMCDVYLQAHMRTPLRGSVTIKPGDLRRYETGDDVHPRELTQNVNELIHFSHLIDPDTGAIGRDGQISNVTYSPAEEAATVAIDSQRDNQEELLARYAVVTGGSQ